MLSRNIHQRNANIRVMVVYELGVVYRGVWCVFVLHIYITNYTSYLYIHTHIHIDRIIS